MYHKPIRELPRVNNWVDHFIYSEKRSGTKYVRRSGPDGVRNLGRYVGSFTVKVRKGSDWEPAIQKKLQVKERRLGCKLESVPEGYRILPTISWQHGRLRMFLPASSEDIERFIRQSARTQETHYVYVPAGKHLTPIIQREFDKFKKE